MATLRARRTLAFRSAFCSLLSVASLASGTRSVDEPPRPEHSPRAAEPLQRGLTLRTVEHLGSRYETMCDPRLNGRQSVDLAFAVAELLAR